MKNYKFIDLFCGCGGLSKGFALAGFESVGGIDFNSAAIKTFNENFRDSKGISFETTFRVVKTADIFVYIINHRIVPIF